MKYDEKENNVIPYHKSALCSKMVKPQIIGKKTQMTLKTPIWGKLQV